MLQISDASLGRDAVSFLGLKVSSELLSLLHEQLDMVIMWTGRHSALKLLQL